MNYNDPLYGPEEIREPVLLAVIESQAMTRLQGVMHHGISGLIGITRPVTRFEHSLGVMFLIRRFGGGLAEQLAGLLHDISHTAFSHTIDYVFDSHVDQSYHDQMKEPYLQGSDLPALLARFGYDWRLFLHDDNFPLLEQPAPALCADRLDYALRDIVDLGLASRQEALACLAQLTVAKGRIVGTDPGWAYWLATHYQAADDQSWSGFREVGVYETAARAIRRGLALGVLTEADIWGTDAAAWAKLQTADDPELAHWLALTVPQTEFVWDEERPTFRVSTKIRTIDPDVLINGQLRRLSELNPAYGEQQAAYIRRKSGEWPMRVVVTAG